MIESDKLVLIRLKEGDKKAFEEIYTQYYNELKNYSISHVKNEDLAKDIISDVFFKIWTNRETIEIKKSLKAYLYASIRYESYKVITKTNKNISLEVNNYEEVLETDNSIEDKINYSETLSKIERCVSLLPSKCAQIFKMSREDRMPHKEIADKLNISTKTVEVQIYRALKKIKIELQ